jgi:hypothetical protein
MARLKPSWGRKVGGLWVSRRVNDHAQTKDQRRARERDQCQHLGAPAGQRRGRLSNKKGPGEGAEVSQGTARGRRMALRVSHKGAGDGPSPLPVFNVGRANGRQ